MHWTMHSNRHNTDMIERSILSVTNKETDLVVKKYLAISVNAQDFEGIQAHSNDPIVILITTSGYKVARVLVDGGSSANLMY